jgi:hypothetical protein
MSLEEQLLQDYFVAKAHVSVPEDFFPKIIDDMNETEQSVILNFSEKLYLEYIWNLFKIPFWDRETEDKIDREYTGPYAVSIGSNIKWKTIDLNNNSYLKTRPFSIYDHSSNKYYFINESLKNKLYQNTIYQNSSFLKSNIIHNILSNEADQIALHFRVQFYYMNIEIQNEDFENYNLIKFNIVKENKNYLTIYSLIDYGIKEPKFDDIIIRNTDITMSDLLLNLESSYLYFNQKN